MVLKKDETEIEIILDGLKSKEVKERARAVSRLRFLFPAVDDSEIEGIVDALSQAYMKERNHKGKKKIEELVKDYKENPTVEERKQLFDEALKEKEKEKERLEKIHQQKEKARKEELILLEKARKEKQDKEIFLRNKILEEEAELSSFTYTSRSSENRFPYHIWYIDIIRTLAVVAVFLGFLGFIFLVEEGAGLFALFSLIWGLFVGFGLLLSSEIIRFLLDFHDNNHVNTKIRIKTLEMLEKISDNLNKRK